MSRNREIQDSFAAMYDKAEKEKRELTAEEKVQEEQLKREFETNQRSIKMYADEATVAGIRESENKNQQLREYLKDVQQKRANATTVLLNPVTSGQDQNSTANIYSSGAIPITIHDVMDTKVEGTTLPAGVNILTGVVGDNLWPISADDVVASVANEVAQIEEQALTFTNIKAVSERVALAVAVSNKAIDNAAFDLFTFVTMKIRKALNILLAKRIYSHAAWTDAFKGPFSLVTAGTITKGEGFAKALAAAVAGVADLGFEGEPTIIIDKVTEAELKYTPANDFKGNTDAVIKDGKLAGYNYITSGHINGELDGDGKYKKASDRYIGIGFFEYLAVQQHGEVRFSVDSTSAAVAGRNSTVFTLNTDFSSTELSHLVNGGTSATEPKAFKLLKIVEEQETA
jgi:hypothetical protein